jgi:hypothetical protein
MDFIFGTVVFCLCLVLFYTYFPNINRQELNDLDEVYLDGRQISESLLSSGHPANWTNSTVERLGIIDNRIINASKLALFSNMTKEDYYRVKALFNIRADFVVFFTNNTDGNENISGIHHVGAPGVSVGSDNSIDLSGIEYKNLAAFTRIITFNGYVKKMVVYAWD